MLRLIHLSSFLIRRHPIKTVITILLLISSFQAWSCTDQQADAIVLNRLTEMAKRYDTTKVGVGASLLWGDTRFTSITIKEGKGGNDGIKVDRIGTILINMDTCVVKGKLISIYDELDVAE